FAQFGRQRTALILSPQSPGSKVGNVVARLTFSSCRGGRRATRRSAMASIHQQTAVEISAEEAWAAVRLVGEAHKLFAPVLLDGRLEGEIRTVRFANGKVVRERIIDVNDERRRVAYSVVD